MFVGVCLIALLVSVSSISTCDEVDVVFLIDTDSIKHKGNTVIEFITAIIWSGSSEHSAFSVVLYGDDIPIHQQVTVISLQDTHDITGRQAMAIRMIDALETVFNRIDSLDASPLRTVTRSVSLLDAFHLARNQNTPNHQHKAKQRLNVDPSYHTDKKVFFVFDHFNTLMNEQYDVLCALFNRVKHHKHESIHFLFGYTYTDSHIHCANAIPRHMRHTLFNHFDENNMNSLLQMVYDITCPSTLYFPEIGGHLRLAHYNQWMDVRTVIKCHLEYVDRKVIQAPRQLDSAKSYILVRDYFDDDNTFKTNDYLLADPITYKQFKRNGCSSSPIYKILSIHRMPRQHSHYAVLKLFVSLPLSVLEYISGANIKGDKIPFHHHRRKKQEETNDRRTLIELKGAQKNKNVIPGGPIHFRKDFVYSKQTEGEMNKEIPYLSKISEWSSLLKAPSVTVEYSGSIELKYGFSFDLESALDFEFLWQLNPFQSKDKTETKLKFKVHGLWHFNAYFDAKFKGHLKVTVNDLLYFSKSFTFFIHVVPVIFEPFLELNLELETIETEIHGRVDCDFAESFQLGYEYEKEQIITPKFGTLRPLMKFAEERSGPSKIQKWSNIASPELCAQTVYQYNYKHGTYTSVGNCYFFDWNRETKECRCNLGEEWGEDVAYEYDKNTYVFRLDYECGSDKHTGKKYLSRCKKCVFWDMKSASDEFYCGPHYLKNDPMATHIPTKCRSKDEDECSCDELVQCALCTKAKPLSETKMIKNEAIKKRTKLATYKGKVMNQCTKAFSIKSGDTLKEDEDETDATEVVDPIHGLEALQSNCPAEQELGFDVIMNFKQGVNLYVIIQIYLLERFTLPFRINLPATDAVQCKKPEELDSCSQELLQMSFTIECIFEVLVGCKFVMPEFPLKLMRELEDSMKAVSEGAHQIAIGDNVKMEKEQITATVKKKITELYEAITKPKELYKGHLIPLRSLGCLTLPNPLSKHFKSVCCPLMEGHLKVQDMTTIKREPTKIDPRDHVELNFDGALKWFNKKGDETPRRQIQLRSMVKNISKTFEIDGKEYEGFEIEVEEESGDIKRLQPTTKWAFIGVKNKEKLNEWLTKIQTLKSKFPDPKIQT